MDAINLFMLLAAVVTLIAIGGVRLGSRLGLPALLFFLLFGMVLGESGFGLEFDDAIVAQGLGYAALTLIWPKAASPRSGRRFVLPSVSRPCWPASESS